MGGIDLNTVVLIFMLIVLVVAPIWIIAHYVTRWRASPGIAASDEKLLGDLWEAARRMEDRLNNLERALGPEPQRPEPQRPESLRREP